MASRSNGLSTARLVLAGVVLVALPGIAAAATLSFVEEVYTAPEGASDLSVMLVLEASRNECPGTLVLPEGFFNLEAVSTGSATGGKDFVEGPSENLPPGGGGVSPIEIGAVMRSLILDDDIDEADETFELAIVDTMSIDCMVSGVPSPLTLDAGKSATVTIVDDDDPPEVAIGGASAMEKEGDAGTRVFVFDVTLSGPSGLKVSVFYGTEDGSAVSGGLKAADTPDYVASSGTIELAPGETSATIEVEVIGDVRFEMDETFSVIIADPLNATLGEEEAFGLILNDDPLPTLSVKDVRVSEGDTGTTAALFVVVLDGETDREVRVGYSTRDRGATSRGQTPDFEATSGSLVFPPGTSSLEVAVDVFGDTIDEGDEKFLLTLSGAEDATIADGEGQATIVDDDRSPSLSISDTSGAEGEDLTITPFTFRVTLSEASGRSVSVVYRTREGTALQGEDFRGQAGRLTFAAGETVQEVTIEVIGDREEEGDERFFVDLSDAQSAGIADGEGVGTITNDDERPAAEVRIASGDGQTGRVNQPLAEPLVVEVLDADGAPVAGAEVSWEVTSGDASLAAAATETGDDGRSSNQVTLGERTGDVVVTASVEGVADPVRFTLSARVADSSQFDEVASPVASAMNVICSRSDLPSSLRAVCNDVAGAGSRQEEALRAIAPEEVSSQGSVAIDSQATQLRNVGARLEALRSGARVSSTVALQLGDVRLSPTQIAGLLGQGGRQDLDPAELVDRQMRRALYGGGAVQEPAPPATGSSSGLGGRLGFFVNGTLGEGNRPGTVRETGFDFDTEGLTAGVDYRLSDRSSLGVAVGYVSDDVELQADGGGLDVDGLSLSLYGTYYLEHFYVEGMLGFGSNDFDMERVIHFLDERHVARAAPGGDQLSASVGLGYDAAVGSWTLGGFGRLDYVDVSIDGFDETGAPGFNLSVGAQDVESLVASLGFQLGYAASVGWGVVQPTMRLGLHHQLEDDSRPIQASFVEDPGGTVFAIPTDDPDRDYFQLGLGLSAVFRGGRQAFVFYEKDLDRDDLNLYLITVGLRLEF